MTQRKIATVVGARPQFIKAGPVSRALAAVRGFSECLNHTGQHFDDNMSAVFFRELALPPTPQYSLGIASQTHGAMTGRMLEAIEAVLLKENPDLVLAYGDTNSTLAGALAAAKLIPIGPVEAGLGSFNRRMPEEINRLVTDHVAAIHFCPSEAAVENLEREGVVYNVHQTGDVMYDATLFA